jgi:hypothetical protein
MPAGGCRCRLCGMLAGMEWNGRGGQAQELHLIRSCGRAERNRQPVRVSMRVIPEHEAAGRDNTGPADAQAIRCTVTTADKAKDITTGRV